MTTYTVDNPNIRFSRGWRINGSTDATTIYCGDTVEIYVANATYVTLLGPAVSGLSSYYPRIRYSANALNGVQEAPAPPFDFTLVAPYDGPSIGGLGGAGSTSYIRIILEDLNVTDDRWGDGTHVPANCWRISGFTTDGTILPLPFPVLDDWYLFGDSTAEGTGAATGPLNGATILKGAEEAFPTALGMALNVNLSRIATGAQGLVSPTGVGNVPPALSAWPYYYNGFSRLTAGQFTIQPKGIIWIPGINDYYAGVSNAAMQAGVTSILSQMRAAAPNALLVMCVPPGGFLDSAITAGFDAWIAATSDNNAIFVDISAGLARYFSGFNAGPGIYSSDGVHYNMVGSGIVAAALAAEIQRQRALKSGPFTGANSVTLAFRDAAGNPVAGVDFSIVGLGTASADASGNKTIGLRNGTFTVRAVPTAGTLWPDTPISVTANATVTITGTAVTIPAPANPAQTTAYLTTRDGQGNPLPSTTLTFQLVDPHAATDSYNQSNFTATSNSSALLEVPLLQNTAYQARVGSGAWVAFTTGSSGAFALPEILGPE